jgi:hypothetical protein
MTIDGRQKLALVFLTTLIALLGYSIREAVQSYDSLGKFPTKIRTYDILLQRSEQDTSAMTVLSQILTNVSARFQGMDFKVNAWQWTRQETLEMSRTIHEFRPILKEDQGKLLQFTATEYPRTAGIAQTLYGWLGKEDSMWAKVQFYLESMYDTSYMGALLNTRRNTAEDALHETQSSLSSLIAAGNLSVVESKSFVARLGIEKDSLLSELKGYRRSFLLHFTIAPLCVVGIIYCSCEVLGLRLRRKETSLIVRP